MQHDGTGNNQTRRGIGIDIEKYQAMIDEPGLSEEEKRRFVEALWQIMVCFVDLGFELHPSTLSCGQIDEEDGSGCFDEIDMIELEHILKQKFDDAAAAQAFGVVPESEDGK